MSFLSLMLEGRVVSLNRMTQIVHKVLHTYYDNLSLHSDKGSVFVVTNGEPLFTISNSYTEGQVWRTVREHEEMLFNELLDKARVRSKYKKRVERLKSEFPNLRYSRDVDYSTILVEGDNNYVYLTTNDEYEINRRKIMDKFGYQPRRYKVGDKVVIRSDLIDGQKYGGMAYVMPMGCGENTIILVTDTGYLLRRKFSRYGLDYTYTDAMIDHEATAALNNPKPTPPAPAKPARREINPSNNFVEVSDFKQVATVNIKFRLMDIKADIIMGKAYEILRIFVDDEQIEDINHAAWIALEALIEAGYFSNKGGSNEGER